MRILIDDVRTIPDTWIFRTAQEGFDALASRNTWTVLFLDHDLGEDAEGRPITSEKVLAAAIEQDLLPDIVYIVSSNPPGVKNLSAALEFDAKFTSRDHSRRLWTRHPNTSLENFK